MVNNKKQEDSGKAIFLLALLCLAVVQFIFFGLITISYHRYLKSRYFIATEGTSIRRINDFNAIYKPLYAIVFAPILFVFFLILPMMMSNVELYGVKSILFIDIPMLFLWLWLSVILFRWLALAHFGVIVDPEEDRIVFHFDQESYNFTDYLKLKFIRDLPKVDIVCLSEIGQITRKRGDDLYLLGSFGSRRITFTNKQKRDECIYAIQHSGRTSAKVPIEFEHT